ncbi:methyltransferase domain-containing protein [Gayadomonas joobiniege]|uniref:methyltransferase domain-containing protein n=1 Tax=Gayadomonas joobiniege TaxID=1234606 RepID=UPI000369874B|nr:methyltransferase domain-containing protein [Gayadomonas joobiniege]
MDRSFEPIADKFNKNIYRTSKGRLRLELLKADLTEFKLTDHSAPLSILDAGCGSGEMALWLAKQGHQVTAVDLSPSLLALGAEQAQQQGLNVNWLNNSIQTFCQHNEHLYDWVICHAVFEWVDDPQAVLTLLKNQLKPGGYLSLMFFNHTAKLFGNLLYGNFDYIDAGMQVKKQVSLNPQNALKPEQVYLWLETNFKLLHKRGIRSIHDYIYDRSLWQSQFEQILKKELAYSHTEPFISLGKYIHVIAQKK